MPSGGYRPGAGRPRKNPIDKKLEGKTTTGTTRPKPAVKKLKSQNVMTEYFSVAMKECEKEVPAADILRAEIEEYIAARGCDGLVAPQTITDYVLNRQGFLACEAMNRKIGRMTKELKLSPYGYAEKQARCERSTSVEGRSHRRRLRSCAVHHIRVVYRGIRADIYPAAIKEKKYG